MLYHPNYIYLAEDSGIEVAALNGAPGIYSARYAGPDATREDMCQKLLKECYGAGNRDAQYQAVMALKFPDETIQTFTGIVRGSLAHEMTGDGGFGYDPFLSPKITILHLQKWTRTKKINYPIATMHLCK